jgi:hypothetical protein
MVILLLLAIWEVLAAQVLRKLFAFNRTIKFINVFADHYPEPD